MRGKVKTKDGMEWKGGAGEKRRNGMKKEKRQVERRVVKNIKTRTKEDSEQRYDKLVVKTNRFEKMYPKTTKITNKMQYIMRESTIKK